MATYFLFSGLVVLLFARSLTFDFVRWDDPILIQDNPLLQLPFFEAVPTLFTTFLHGDYMPLTQFFWWLLSNLFALEPAIYHAASILLHALNVILLGKVLEKFHPGDGRAFFALLLFAFHPLQVESVAWVSEHKGLLATTCLLIAAYFSATDYKFPWISLLAFSSSLLFKGIGVFLPFVLFFFVLVDRREKLELKPRLLRLLPFLAISLIYSWVRTTAYNESLGPLVRGEIPWSYWTMLPGLWGAALIGYCKMLFFPLELSIIHPFVPIKNLHYALFVMALLFTFILWMRSGRERRLFLLILAGLLLPVLHLVPRVNFINERYLYLALPLLPFLFSSTSAIPLAGNWRRLAGVILFLLLGGLTSLRLGAWENSKTLWHATYEILPTHPMVLNHLAEVYQGEGQYAKALEYWDQSLAYDQSEEFAETTYNNLAILFASPETSYYNLQRARFYIEKAIAASKRPVSRLQSELNLAILTARLEDNATSQQILRRMLAEIGKYPNDAQIQALKARVENYLQ
jgi:hypothetical protein